MRFEAIVRGDNRSIRLGVLLVLLSIGALAGGIIMNRSLGVFHIPKPDPALILGDSVAGDLRVLASETWEQFMAAFEPRTACFGDVRLEATRDLESRATYDPSTATVTIRVPGTSAMLRGALVHEWAHHIEFQCQDHVTLRPPFLAVLGMPMDSPWRAGDALTGISDIQWAETPSEQFAEATIVMVLGERSIPTQVRVSDLMVRVIEEWAAGD